MHSIVEIFGRKISTYSLCAIAGGVALVLYYIFQCKHTKKNSAVKIEYRDMLFMLVYAAVGLLIGAKLLFLITSTDFVWYSDKNFWENLWIWAVQIASGGFVFYGGLIGAILGSFVYMRKYKAPYSEMFDMGVSGIPLFHAFGRVGCFLGGCCYGMEYHGPFAVVYPEGSLGGAPAGVELLPVQLIETALNIILWAVLVIVYRKTSRRWFTSGVYFVSYGIMRFTLEFFRGDLIRGHVSVLSTSQFISFFIVAAGVLLIIKPSWLERFGGVNDAAYLETVELYKKRVAEYKEYKAARKAFRESNGKK